MVPGPLIQAKYGEPIMVRYHNNLPSVKIPQDFGIAEMTHPSAQRPHAFRERRQPGQLLQFDQRSRTPVNPNGFKDQHYPNVLAGFTDPQYGPAGNPNEALGSLWYHDHHLDFTAQNVYKGMFGCYNLFDDLDTGTGSGLGLPHGEFDIPIFFHDALFDKNCQTVFDLFNLDGILGDRFLANGVIQPYLNVKKCRYRFRLYAPGPSRWWEWSLWDGTNFLPFWQISTDGNLLPNAVQVTSVRIAVAERVDIIVDFSKIKANRGLLRQPRGAGQRPRPDRQDAHPRHAGSAGQPDRWQSVSDDSADPSVGAVRRGGHEAARSAGHGLRRPEGQGGQTADPHLAVRARQRRLDGERQVLRRERGQCRDPDGLGRGLDHPEPRRLLASPGAYPLRRASDADP